MTAQGSFFDDSIGATGTPDPGVLPEAYRGILTARVLAFLTDLIVLAVVGLGAIILFAILGILTFGLLWPGGVLFPVLFFAYFTASLGGKRSATPGMRWQGIEMRVWNGNRPGYVQAFVQTVLFYVTVSVLTVLVLLVPLFNGRRRCLHDFLSGSVFVRTGTFTSEVSHPNSGK